MIPRPFAITALALLGHSCAHSQVIVTPEWLRAHPEAAILEASWATTREYDAGHIPGAVHVNTDDFENGYPRWHLRALPDLHAALGRLGIRPEATVVVYGAQTIAAARIWWVLHYAGVRDVRLLDGGYAAWQRAGFQGETTAHRPAPAVFTATPRTASIATTGSVRENLGRALLADVRSRDEFLGRTSGYDYLARKGRIPGAIHLENAGDSAAIYVSPDGRLRALPEIERLWQSRGLLDETGKPKAEIIFYCGSGWRSSLAYLYATALGFDRIRNYSDGWSGWSTVYESAPGEKGITPGWRQRESANPIALGLP